MTANQMSAQATLKTISTALESYAAFNMQGAYPTDISDVVTGSPPYLTRDFIDDSPIHGYNYICGSLAITGYSCSANPVLCNQTGSKTYTITTGSVLAEADCS